MKHIRSLWQDIFSVFILGISGYLMLRDFSEKVDVNLTDDSGYLTLGIYFPKLMAAGFGPLYSVIFKVFKQVFNDHLALYDFVICLLSVAPAICAYIFLRALKVSSYWALLFSGLFLFSPVNMAFITWSKISHYSICLIFLWVAAATRLKDTFHIICSLVVLTFLLGYVRPEYHLSWYLSSILLLLWWIGVRRFKVSGKELLVMVPVAALMLVMLKFPGNPMAGNRTYVAFAQQFSYNYCEWENLNHYDWIQWPDIAREQFGEFNTLGEAYANNPEMFRKHVGYNIQQYFKKSLEGVRAFFLPPAVFYVERGLSWLFVLLLLLARIMHVGWPSWPSQVLEFLKANWIFVLAILLLSAPSVVASLVFYTREHYLVLQMPLLFMLFALILYPKATKAEEMPRIVTRAALPASAVLLLLLKPDMDDYPKFNVWEQYYYPSNRATIHAVRALGITKQQVNELDHEGGFFIYIGKNYKWIKPSEKYDMSFDTFVDSAGINMIYVTRALTSNRHFGQDPSFNSFLLEPEKFGFYKMALEPENQGYLLLHDSLQVKIAP